MEYKNFSRFLPPRLWLLIAAFILTPSLIFSSEAEKISLKRYRQLALPVSNPMDMTKLSNGQSYQVTHARFILQFYIDGKNTYGVILKRKKDDSIYMHWCLFRDCEESPYDYKFKIANAFTPPYDQMFFTAKLPPQIKYQFQGLEFYTLK